MIPVVEATLLVAVVVSAVAVALLRDVLAAIAVFAVFSLALSVVWVVLGAPDVALTEAAVGAGVMSFLLIVTLARTTRAEPRGVVDRPRLAPTAVALILLVALTSTVPALPAVGDPAAPAFVEAVDGVSTPYGHYVESAYDETGVENAVTAVLVYYRGFDTLGEAVVVFSALVGVLLVLGRDESL
ncbi:MAG: DUF4040 domain-containing protein [Halobacteriales archaeon]